MKSYIYSFLLCISLTSHGFANQIGDLNCDDYDKVINDEPKAYPNPFKSKITINHSSAEKIEIYTVLGETIKVVNVSSLDRSTTLDLSDLKKGVYFYAVKSDNSIIETRRIIKSE